MTSFSDAFPFGWTKGGFGNKGNKKIAIFLIPPLQL